jgi:quercetin dioxygenase-like cupin family protein
MKVNHLLEELEFHESDPFAQPLLVDNDGRILRWMFKPGQSIAEHRVPNSPLYVVVLKGHGMFSSNGEPEQEFGPNTLLTFEPNEAHTVRALDEEFVFVSFLQAVETPQRSRTSAT